MTGVADTLEMMPDRFRLEPASRPTVDARAFRDAMASMAATACLVTTQHGGERLGRTVTSVFSLSVEPPAILVSIDVSSQLADHVLATRGFSFAILAEDQSAIADAFAGRGAPDDRFGNGTWTSWRSGHPRLSGGVAAMDCTLIGAIETGTHILFAGAVVDLDLTPHRRPLIWHDRHYKSLAGFLTPRPSS